MIDMIATPPNYSGTYSDYTYGTGYYQEYGYTYIQRYEERDMVSIRVDFWEWIQNTLASKLPDYSGYTNRKTAVKPDCPIEPG